MRKKPIVKHLSLALVALLASTQAVRAQSAGNAAEGAAPPPARSGGSARSAGVTATAVSADGGAAAVEASFAAPTQRPWGLAWDGANFWLASNGDQRIYKLSTSFEVISSFVTPSAFLTGLTYGDGHLWATEYYGGRIYKFDPATGEQVATFPTPAGNGSAFDGLAFVGSFMYVGGFAQPISRVDVNTGEVLGQFPAPDYCTRDLAWDGENLWAIETNPGGGIYKLAADGTVLDFFTLPQVNFPIGVVCDGSTLVVSGLWDNLIHRTSIACGPLDTAPPVTTPALAGKQGNDGWWVSEVTVTLTAVDPEPRASGVASTEYQLGDGAWTPYTAPFTVSTDGGTSFCFRSKDHLDNQEPMQCASFRIDRTPPLITISVPTAGAAFLLRQAVAPSWGVGDSGSGTGTITDSFGGGPLDTSTVGEKSFTVTASDVAGNPASSTVTYYVRYGWSGFSSPKTTTEKVGNIVPIKFKLLDSSGATVTTATPRLTLLSPTGAVVDKGAIRFDALEQQYVYQLATKGFAAGAWTISVAAGDGLTYSVPMTLTLK